MEKVGSLKVAAVIRNLEFTSKEMRKLVKKINGCNTPDEDTQNKLASHCVEASLFINCFAVAGETFKSMLKDLNEGDLKGDILFYLKEEFNTYYELIKKQTEKEEDSPQLEMELEENGEV